MKILIISTFLRKHTPPNVTILHLLVPILKYYSGQKLDFKILRFSSIIKSMFFHYNLKKRVARRDFPLENSFFLAVPSYMVYKVIVDWIKVLKVCVSKRHSLMYNQFISINFKSSLSCPAISRHFQSFPAISATSSTFYQFSVISIHFQPFQPIPAKSNYFQSFRPFPAIFSHFQPLLAIYSQFKPFQAI